MINVSCVYYQQSPTIYMIISYRKSVGVDGLLLCFTALDREVKCGLTATLVVVDCDKITNKLYLFSSNILKFSA